MKFLDIEKYTPIQKSKEGYLKELMEYCKDTPRHPSYHIHPPCGLLNDPNGLAYFEGKYHVFYQWFPFGPEHGMKHWAHVISEDLLNWKWSDQMLIPDQEYEKNGCYSGNSIEVDDKLYLYYTANYKTKHGKIPKQAMAVMNIDGAICKNPYNPIIDEQPEGLIGEIRDPFVFEKEGAYWMFLGGGSIEGEARLLLYKSTDLENWKYYGNIELTGIDLNLGYMYECPSYIEIDGKDVLCLSLMGRTPVGERFHNEFSSVYFIGKLKLEDKTFYVESFDEMDKGFDFYAPQVFYGKDAQPMMFAWFGCGVQELPYAKEDMWIHSLTMPRLLTIEEGKLCQRIPENIKDAYKNINVDSKVIIPEEKTWHMRVEDKESTEIQIGKGQDYLSIRLDWAAGHVTVDRSNLKHQFCMEYGAQRSVSMQEELNNIDIYYDNTFIEIYLNDGKDTITLRAFPENVEIKLI